MIMVIINNNNNNEMDVECENKKECKYLQVIIMTTTSKATV